MVVITREGWLVSEGDTGCLNCICNIYFLSLVTECGCSGYSVYLSCLLEMLCEKISRTFPNPLEAGHVVDAGG